MSSAGHVLDMIKRSRYNDSIRKKRIERISKIKDIFQEEIRKYHHIDFVNKEVSQEELTQVKANIKKRIKTDERRVVVSTILLTLFVIVFCGFVFVLWINYVN